METRETSRAQAAGMRLAPQGSEPGPVPGAASPSAAQDATEWRRAAPCPLASKASLTGIDSSDVRPRAMVVDMAKQAHVSIGATGLAGLEQEVRTVLATRKGSVPLDRDFGISWDFVDKPLTEAMPSMVAEIGRQLERYVPRIRVTDIAFSSPDAVEGILQPTVTVEIREEYLNDFA